MSGDIVTFYSYKGGVGRSFALANIATLLARWGYTVLCIDWDLEAPGLHRYFKHHVTDGGLLGLVEGVGRGEELNWRASVRRMNVTGTEDRLHLLPAGPEHAPWNTSRSSKTSTGTSSTRSTRSAHSSSGSVASGPRPTTSP